MPTEAALLPELYLSTSERSSSALAEVPTRRKSFWQALMTQSVSRSGPAWSRRSQPRPALLPARLLVLHVLRPRLDRVHRLGTSRLPTLAHGRADLHGGGGEPPGALAGEAAVADAGRGRRGGGRRPELLLLPLELTPRPADRGHQAGDQRGETRASTCLLSGAATARPFTVRSHSMPSTTSLPVSSDPATPVRGDGQR